MSTNSGLNNAAASAPALAVGVILLVTGWLLEGIWSKAGMTAACVVLLIDVLRRAQAQAAALQRRQAEEQARKIGYRCAQAG